MSKAFHTPEEWQDKGWSKLEEAAEHIKKWVDGQGVKGLKSEIIQDREKDLTPIIFIEIEGEL